MAIRDGSTFMEPFVVGATALLGGLAILELVSGGQIRSADNSADLYLALIGAYAGAGELKRWLTQGAGREPLTADEAWLARARKGGFFVGFWLLLYAAALLWRVVDAGVPMPHELKAITLRTVGVFFVTYSSRRVYKARRGKEGGLGSDTLGDEARILKLIQQSPAGLTRQDLTKACGDLNSWTLRRLLQSLQSSGRIRRQGPANRPECRYFPIASPDIPSDNDTQ